MKILELMNAHSNWEEIIQRPPYSIKIIRNGEYVLLKYNQLSSDFNEPIVRECRGSIFRQEGSRWICVCHPFDKFGNYGESYAPKIDWVTATVMEKVDGSLMKMWYDRGFWHLSTNGTIDAFDAPLGAFSETFGDYFIDILIEKWGCLDAFEVWEGLDSVLDPSYTYMFELVGPKNRVIIDYKTQDIYFLGARSVDDDKEVEITDFFLSNHFSYPKFFKLSTLSECLEAAGAMSKDEEGFVVCDASFNRLKIKSPEYLFAAHLNNNGVITQRRLLEIIWEERLDDFLAYCPQYESEAKAMLLKFGKFIDNMVVLKEMFSRYKNLDGKEYWQLASKYPPYADFLTQLKRNGVEVMEYLNHQVKHRGIDWLLRRIESAEV